ncbi:HNH endonuclease [Nocardioides sp. J54]|uniref:HNH endonuclease n=1 Tax=Nocardioides sp. J54 TaxID=935866 RepID=UPI0004BB2F38|nr:HNH endonuclease signature motif containing protein [Nocardioides sp. J54]
MSVGDVLADVSLWPSGDRHPVVRHGDRAEIPTHVRAAVWFRDRGLCKLCGSDTPTDQPLHLDHITPWSAGGPDTTDNLRLLCERHNLERSNFDDGTRQARPATWWCINCYSREGYGWEYVGGFVRCLMHPRGLGCRVGNRYQREAIAGGEVTNWHEREPIVHASVLAYCAHCDAPGMTDQPL